MSLIHETAIVHPEAKIASNVEIGPFSMIGPNVEIEEGTKIASHVIVEGHTKIGKNNQFFQYSTIGTAPQDLTYNGEPTRVEIGDNNVFREYVSIHRGTMKDAQVTRIGNSSLFMAYVHLGHDVQFGSNCVIANAVNFAGHVKVGDRVIIGGGSLVSQFVSIGRGAYLGGASAVDRDIPQFCTAYGNRVKLKGINIIGLRRQKYEKKIVSEVVEFYRTMETSILSPRAFVTSEEMMNEYKDNEVISEISEFISKSEVGIAPFIL